MYQRGKRASADSFLHREWGGRFGTLCELNILHLLHCSGCQIITAAELHFISLQVDLAPGNGAVMKTTPNEAEFNGLNQTGSQMLAGLKD